jgi:hypothetical protein
VGESLETVVQKLLSLPAFCDGLPSDDLIRHPAEK